MYKETIIDIVLGIWLGLLIGDIAYMIGKRLKKGK